MHGSDACKKTQYRQKNVLFLLPLSRICSSSAKMSASGHEEDEDNHDGYGRAAFPINTMAAAPSGTPTTGEEYLAFVREESKQYSSILVKRLHAIDDKESKDEEKNGIFGRLPKTPKRLQPDETWMKETVKGFVKVRENIQKKRSDSEGNQKREERDWKNWAFETEERKGFEQIVEWDEVTLMNILEFVDEHVDKTGEQLKLGRCTECIYAVMAAVSL